MAASTASTMEKKQKILHFKQAKLVGESKSLQQAIEARISKLSKPSDRLEWVTLARTEARVLLHPRHNASLLCFTLGVYEKGKLQPVLGLGDGLDEWFIEQTEPPAIKGTTSSEFLEGYLYAAVLGNYVVFSGTRSCGPEDLESYLSWLLSTHEEPLEPGDTVLVALNDRSPTSVRKKKLSKVHAVSLNTSIRAHHQAPAPDGKDVAHQVGLVKPIGEIWTALKHVVKGLGGVLDEDTFLSKDGSPEDIQVKVVVSCPRRATETAGPFIDAMANAFRNREGDHIEIEFDDGSKMKGTDLKTRKTISIDCSGGMPVPTQMDKALQEYLAQLVIDGTIEPAG